MKGLFKRAGVIDDFKEELKSSDDPKKVWKEYARKHHPDAGGDTSVFQDLQNAWERHQESGGGFEGMPGSEEFNWGGNEEARDAWDDFTDRWNKRRRKQEDKWNKRRRKDEEESRKTWEDFREQQKRTENVRDRVRNIGDIATTGAGLMGSLGDLAVDDARSLGGAVSLGSALGGVAGTAGGAIAGGLTDTRIPHAAKWGQRAGVLGGALGGVAHDMRRRKNMPKEKYEQEKEKGQASYNTLTVNALGALSDTLR